MGYLVNGQCLWTAEQAAQAACGQYPVTQASGGVVTTWSCSGVEAGVLQLSRTDDGGAAPVASELAVSFPECDAAQKYTDMSQLFGLLLVATLAVYLVKQFIYKQVANQ